MKYEKISEVKTDTLENQKQLAKVSDFDKKEEITQKVDHHASFYAIKRAAQKLRSVINGNCNGPVFLSFGDMRYSLAYWYSILGTAGASETEYQYYQTTDVDIRNGQRFMDRFTISRLSDKKPLRLFYLSNFTDAANLFAEDNPNTLRGYTFTVQDFPFQILPVTFLIPHDFIIADTTERTVNFLIVALIERVLDSLNKLFIIYVGKNATPFSPTTFAGYLNFQTTTEVRWHDLIAAMQIQFATTFADHILPLKYGDIIISSPHIYWGIQRDRISHGYAHYGTGGVFGANALEVQNIMYDTITNGLVLTNTRAIRIEVIDEVQVYFKRVIENASEKELYRLTAEVYYRFVPMKLPLPAIVSNGLSDLKSLQP
jgi:hypothetical protein